MARHPVTEVTQDRLLELGNELAAAGEKWHPHVLSPDCQLNDRPLCGLILEASDRDEVFATYSEEPMMETARSLAALAHGEDALQADSGAGTKPESPEVGEMMRRAKTLSGRGKHWHHHVLFHDCIFNKHPGEWTIVFEDPETGETLESVTIQHPAKDIQVAETMFFAQSAHR